MHLKPYISWYANKTAWMVGDTFAEWMTRLNNEFKNAGRKVLMIMDNFSTHSLENVAITQVHGFNCLALSHMSIVFCHLM